MGSTSKQLPVNHDQLYLSLQHTLCTKREKKTRYVAVAEADCTNIWHINFAENGKTSMMCGCLLIYDLFILFLRLNMPKAFCFGYLQAREDFCQSVSEIEEPRRVLTYYPTLWGGEHQSWCTHPHKHKHAMHGMNRTDTDCFSVDCSRFCAKYRIQQYSYVHNARCFLFFYFFFSLYHIKPWLPIMLGCEM